MRRPLGMVALMVAIIMMGWIVISGAPPGRKADWNLLSGGEELVLTGRVYDVQERQAYGTTQLWIYLDSILIQQYHTSVVEADISYHLICQTVSAERPLIGSRIQVTGQFEPFSQARNPGQFDAAQYYETLGIRGKLKKAHITGTDGNCSYVKEALYKLRIYWKEKLYDSLPEKEASILCAMLLGDKTDLDSEVKELYQQNGIVHILSISGLHITLIGMSLYKLLRRLGCPIVVAVIIGGSLLVLYGMMTGLGVSAVRAIGMYLIRMLGELLGRTYDMMTALGVMALTMLAFRPMYLQNGGFLLSFGSICGIGLILPMFSGKNAKEEEGSVVIWKSYLRKQADRIKARLCDSVFSGLSISLFTLPIQLIMFYEIPVYAIFLNLLILPFISTVMTAGMAALMIPGAGKIGLLSAGILQGYEWLCTLFEKLPGHTWNPGAPQLWQIVIYYVLLAVCLIIHSVRKRTGYKIVLLAGAVVCIGIRFPEELSVTFLDVGQGDCICVRTKEEVYLFDCGSSSESRVGENILIPYLKHEGIKRLDGVFISHPDEDHISGILELLAVGQEEGIVVERLILPDIAKENREETFGSLMEAAADGATADAARSDGAADSTVEARQIPIVYMGKGATWQSGNVQFTCLHPEPGNTYADTNAYSQCFLAEYHDFSMLLTGDVEGEGEEALAKELAHREVEKITLLKVAHHGSKYSTSEELLERLKPDLAVISCGQDNSYGHPHEELLARLSDADCRIYQTPETGAIELHVRREKLRISKFCEWRECER